MKQDPITNLGLNPQQLEAVRAPLGPVLILAGAGSGKTRALTMRIVYLISKLKFLPHQILAVTFTNKAAGEMKARVMKLLEQTNENSPAPRRSPPAMGTFHSIGARILREEAAASGSSEGMPGLNKNFVIYDDSDSESLIKDILINQRVDPTKYKPSLFRYFIDRAKNNLAEPLDVVEDDLSTPLETGKKFRKMLQDVYVEYEEALLKNNAVDFGDLIMKPVKLFQFNKEVLKKYQQRWQYILIDEYQDTNHAQYTFAKLLASAHKNIFAVGDDAQAIYGFRGANLQNILDFEKDYSNTKVIRLEQNYRSTSPILAVAEKIIEQSPQQYRKKLWTDNSEGSNPILYAAEDEMAEAWFVAKTIVELQDGPASTHRRGEAGVSGELTYVDEADDSILAKIMRRSQSRIVIKLKNRMDLNHIAVLYRTHAQSRALEETCIEASIPYQIVGGLKFYERKEIKDLLAYLRLIINANDLVALKRVINVPPRGIGPKTFDQLKTAMLNKEQESLNSLFAAKPAVKSFFDILDSINALSEEANVLDVLRHIVKLTDFEQYLKNDLEQGQTRLENVQELFNVAAVFEKYPWRVGLEKFLEEVALMTGLDDFDPSSSKVTLMTLHQAKGLEFDTVFLVGLEEGILPHSRTLQEPKEIAEEVRLAYVGATRAKKRLYLVYAHSRKQFGLRQASVPSRILRGIPEELLDIYEPRH